MSGIRAHPWDDSTSTSSAGSSASGAGDEEHPWDASDSESDAASDDDLPDPRTDPLAAADEFVDVLTGLYTASVLPGKVLTTLCYWAVKAGMKGAPEHVALKPSSHSGHCTRKINKQLGFDAFREMGYTMTCPGMRKHDAARTTFLMELVPPHDVIWKEAASDESLVEKLRAAKQDLPPSYHEHPVVSAHPGEDVLPLAIYSDGLPYSQTDSVVGVWIINMISSRRHLVALVRKRLTCKCGCRGQCTWDAVNETLAWSLRSLASNTFPGARADGKIWHNRDENRQLRAGSTGQIRAAIVQIKGDWAELCSRLGYPTWSSKSRPCFLCNSQPEELGKVTGCSLFNFPHRLNSSDDYKSAISRCTFDVSVSEAQHRHLRLALRYDKRKEGARGLALASITGLEGVEPRLEVGDRLQPSDQLRDIGGVWSVRDFPLRLRFWRRSAESISLFACPLFDYTIGIIPDKVICADILHTYHLGVVLHFCRFAIWQLLGGGAWGVCGAAPKAAVVARLRDALWVWYEIRSAAYAAENLTRLADLTPGMIGTQKNPSSRPRRPRHGVCCCSCATSCSSMLQFWAHLPRRSTKLHSSWSRSTTS